MQIFLRKLFVKSSDNIKIIKNILWLLFGYLFRIVSNLVIASLVAKQLGVEQYGLFQYVLGLVVVFISLSYVCGAEVLVPKLVHAHDFSVLRTILGSSFIIRIFCSVLAYILLLIFVYTTSDTPTEFYLALILGITILFSEGFGVVIAWLQSQTQIRPYSISVNIILIFKVASIVLLDYFSVKNPVVYAIPWGVEAVFIAIALMLIFYKEKKTFFFQYSWSLVVQLLKEGASFFPAILLTFIFKKLDMIFLKSLVTSVELSYYATAAQLVTSVTAISTILVNSMAPLRVYSKAHIKDIRRNVIFNSVILFVLSALFAVFGQLIAPVIIPFIFDKSFSGAIPILSWLLWCSTLLFVDASLNTFLIKMKLGMYATYKWLIAVIVSSVAYYILIPKLGVTGAILGYALGYLVACVIGIYFIFTKRIDEVY